MHETTIMGYIGQDATVRQTQGDTAISFSIATTKTWKDEKGVKQERTKWTQCTLWTKEDKISAYLKKGTPIWVRGEIDSEVYKDKNGETRTSLRLTVDKFRFVPSKKDETTATPTPPVTAENIVNGLPADDDDDLPF